MMQLDYLDTLGIKYKIVSVSHLADLRWELEEKYYLGILKSEVYERYLASLSFAVPEELPDAQSIIVLALQKNRTEAVFNFENKKRSFAIPPTYNRYKDSGSRMQQVLSDILRPYGFSVTKAKITEKALAVHSGLAYYGKNNITYIPEWGSFYQLVAFFSDMPVENDEWHEFRLLERCSKCSACEKVCPTNAISGHRFTINAEKCLTFLNENELEFPEGLNPKAHNSLIGCMYCQFYCPEDKYVRNKIDESTEFSEDETLQILRAEEPEMLPGELLNKLQKLDLVFTHMDYTNLQRNIKLLLNNTDNFL